MKPVVYHRLAASELIKSAEFYEHRNPTLGGAFLDSVEATLPKNSAPPGIGQARQVQKPQLENKTIPFPNCISGAATPALDRGGHTFEPQPGLLDSTGAII